MSEQDAALFWEMDPDRASKPRSETVDPAPPSETVPTAGDIFPEKVAPIVSVPTSEPDDSRRVNTCTALSDVIQDTKPVEQQRAVCDQEPTGTTAENILTPRPLYLQATIGTQTEAVSEPEEPKMPEVATETPPPSTLETDDPPVGRSLVSTTRPLGETVQSHVTPSF